MDRTVTFEKDTSGHEPQSGLDTKIDRLTDRKLQSDFDLKVLLVHGFNMFKTLGRRS
jgi:hypothetical protein